VSNIIIKILMTADIESLINFIQYFWFKNRYSVFNCILIYAQRPGAIMLADERQWEERYGRHIKPEASPIVILKPFGPVDFIYEYDDTFGEEELYPERLTRSKSLDIKEWWANELISSLMDNGILYAEKNFGGRQGAELIIDSFSHTYHFKNKEKTTDCCITVNSMSDEGAKFTSILHELGHLFCGHIPKGKYTPKNIHFPDRKNDHLTINQMESEAELTKNLVCRILGIKLSNPYEYLRGYTEENGKLPDVNFYHITLAADKILNLIPQSIVKDSKFNNNGQVSIFDF
jgi:hypothetical protein